MNARWVYKVSEWVSELVSTLMKMSLYRLSVCISGIIFGLRKWKIFKINYLPINVDNLVEFKWQWQWLWLWQWWLWQSLEYNLLIKFTLIFYALLCVFIEYVQRIYIQQPCICILHFTAGHWQDTLVRF